MTSSHTLSGEASISIDAVTLCMAPSSRSQRLLCLPVAQGALDGGVEAVQAHAEQACGQFVKSVRPLPSGRGRVIFVLVVGAEPTLIAGASPPA